jgi:hypothetical protein
MSKVDEQTIVVSVTSLDQLFNAPPINPLSDKELSALGEPALTRAVRRLQEQGWRRRKDPVRLIVKMPTEQMTPALPEEVSEAVRRYCAAKIADNALEIHLARSRSARGLGIAITLVLILAFIVYLLLFVVLPQASEVIRGIIVGSLSVFAWVVLWDTLEALLFNPIPPSFENRALRRLSDAAILVEPER